MKKIWINLKTLLNVMQESIDDLDSSINYGNSRRLKFWRKKDMIFVLVMRLSFVDKRVSRGERKTAYPVHNRCPINFVIGGLPLTATITVVEGGWRPSCEDVRARSSSSLPTTRHFISTTGSIVVCTQSLYTLPTDLSFRSLSFLSLHSFFFQAFPNYH